MDDMVTKRQVELIIKETISDRLKSIEDSMKDIAEIKRVLLGDGIYTKVGMKEQHDQMYHAFASYQDDQVPFRVKELWESYQAKKNSKLDEKIDKIVEAYTSAKWTARFFGVTTFAAFVSLIIGIAACLKIFGVI